MIASHPPRLAQWLLERYASGPQRESLIGDLVEQYRRGRSAAWFWRQTIRTIGANLVPALAIAALGLSLPRISCSSPSGGSAGWTTRGIRT